MQLLLNKDAVSDSWVSKIEGNWHAEDAVITEQRCSDWLLSIQDIGREFDTLRKLLFLNKDAVSDSWVSKIEGNWHAEEAVIDEQSCSEW